MGGSGGGDTREVGGCCNLQAVPHQRKNLPGQARQGVEMFSHTPASICPFPPRGPLPPHQQNLCHDVRNRGQGSERPMVSTTNVHPSCRSECDSSMALW